MSACVGWGTAAAVVAAAIPASAMNPLADGNGIQIAPFTYQSRLSRLAHGHDD